VRAWPPWVGPALVASFAATLFAATLGHGYAFDDHRALLAHPAVTGEAPVWEVFLREFWGRRLDEGWSSSYRPLTTLTFALEHRIWAAPTMHHAGSVGLYAGLCAMVTHGARRWCRAGTAVVVGLLFAALPIHVENVASIVGRADVLAAMAGLGAVLIGVPTRPDAAVVAPWRAVVAAALYGVGLLCKETIALLPVLAAWLAWVTVRPHTALRWRALHPVVAMALVGLAYLWVRNRILPVGLPSEFVAADNLLVQRAGLARLWGNFAVLGHYAELTVIPRRLCADHTYADVIPPTHAFEAEAIWAWVGIAVAAWAAWSLRRALRGDDPGLGVAAVLAYVLVGQWVVDLSVIVAERLALWPTLWLMLALGAATDRSSLRRTPARSNRLLALVAALGLLASLRTVDRSLDWRDSVTLHRSSLRSCPAAVHSRLILAHALRERGEAAEAVWHYALAGAGRAAFPGPVDLPAFAAEDALGLDERLRRLPELVDAPDASGYWIALHRFLSAQGAGAEAEIVRDLALAAEGVR
jgi:protein O-mannosyl-transferase